MILNDGVRLKRILRLDQDHPKAIDHPNPGAPRAWNREGYTRIDGHRPRKLHSRLQWSVSVSNVRVHTGAYPPIHFFMGESQSIVVFIQHRDGAIAVDDPVAQVIPASLNHEVAKIEISRDRSKVVSPGTPFGMGQARRYAN